MKKYLLSMAVLAMGMAVVTSCDDSDKMAPVAIASVNDDKPVEAVANQSVTLAPNIANADAGTAYAWLDEAGNTVGTGASYTFTPTEAGTYQFLLRVTTSDGRQAAKTFTVVVAEDLRTVTFEGNEWAALIDSPQYGGVLLYGPANKEQGAAVEYSWTDANTKLCSELTAAWGGSYGYSEGGVAISNYIDADVVNNANYLNQLAVPVANGSANFAVVYCDASVTFADGVARQILSMDVAPTTYQLGVTKHGDGYAASLAESGELYVTVTGYNGEQKTGTLTIYMAKDGSLLETWKTVDFSSLGKVTKLCFTMDGSDQSDYGVKHPKYFAFDNVVIKF